MRLRGSSFCTPRAKKKKKKKSVALLHVMGLMILSTGKDLRVVVSCVVVMKRGGFCSTFKERKKKLSIILLVVLIKNIIKWKNFNRCDNMMSTYAFA